MLNDNVQDPATLFYFSNLPISVQLMIPLLTKDQNCCDKLRYINQAQLYSFAQLMALASHQRSVFQ